MKRSIKDAAKKGQKDVCIILAKELIQSRRAISKLYASKAQMNSVVLSMKNQLGECVKTLDVKCARVLFGLVSLVVVVVVLMSAHLILAVVRVAGALQKSTEVMKAMQSLVKIPEIQSTMRELSKEMMKVRSTPRAVVVPAVHGCTSWYKWF